jgi:ribosome maturation factor RimP
MPKTLTLEVSSPGVYRALKEVRQFETAIGDLVSLTLNKEVEELQEGATAENLPKNWKKSKKIKGKVLGCTESAIEISHADAKSNVKIKIPFNEIKRANVDPDLNDLLYKEVRS